MTKLLAALNLPQVGEITMLPKTHEDDVDYTGALFSIELNDRQYMLKAASQKDAEMWVEKLIALKSSPHMNIVDNPVGDVGGVVQDNPLRPCR
eukprot:FR737720.1.p1 GENE.FR737720.1~~FR737720.1.p1  ORF type:complete len:107 (+),score=12.88 FR737720.1:45-323(+)